MPILEVSPLSLPWKTQNPFLFCVHHLDLYPESNGQFGPKASLGGRRLGNDFAGQDGWNMYHGRTVPGFPVHPHRGFETVTLVRRGVIDHADSLGAAARFGEGDVQWMTAGKGVQHSEMFPLLHEKEKNTLELFQIWLNLPKKHKMVEPYFTMLWNERIPVITQDGVSLTLIAGQPTGISLSQPLPSPPPHSWAADPRNGVWIWTIRLAPGASWKLPAAGEGLSRSLFFFEGAAASFGGKTVQSGNALRLESHKSLEIKNGMKPSEFLLLQGRPIEENIVQHGPFVMNSPAEIRQAMLDYQNTQFGGWPWETSEPVHADRDGRFARYPDGREESPWG